MASILLKRRAMTIGRRKWLQVAAGSVGGLAATEALASEKGETKARSEKLAHTTTFTTACNFCSCGCGMVGSVRDGKLVNLEGDPEHAVNQGALCSKGAAMFETHESAQRLREPMIRRPGSYKWEAISWDEALDRIARKLKETRDATWIAEDEGKPAMRTDAIGFLGGAQNTNEECYLYAKAARLFGTPYVEHQARL